MLELSSWKPAHGISCLVDWCHDPLPLYPDRNIIFHSLTPHVQEKSALDTHAVWQLRQQKLRARNPKEAGMALEESVSSISSSTAQRGLRQESESIRRGEVPVFRLPGVKIRLPTAVGMVTFSPLFMSKKQLSRTWVSNSLAPPDGLCYSR